MRLSIKAKQVLGVATIVGVVVAVLSVLHLAALVRVGLQESQARGRLIAQALFERARAVAPPAEDPYAALGADPGVQAILRASLNSPDVIDPAIVDAGGHIVAHYDPVRLGQALPDRGEVQDLMSLNGLSLLWTVYQDEGRTIEVREPLRLGGTEFGAIRVGISTLLIRDELRRGLQPAALTAAVALLVSTVVAMLLAQLLLRPITVLRSGLQRLARGERELRVDLPQDEFGELVTDLRTFSETIAARAPLVGPGAGLESVVAHLEDAVAIFDAGGTLLFANPKLRALLPPAVAAGQASLDQDHPFGEIVQSALASGGSCGPIALALPDAAARGDAASPTEWLITAHPIGERGGATMGVMLMARDLDTIGELQSTLRYSRKLVALGRLSAGVAHEVKNPLNAMTIHLELLRQKLGAGRPARNSGNGGGTAPPVDVPGAVEHVAIIATEIRRLDQVVQGFLRFARADDLQLKPVQVGELLEEIARVVEPEARAGGVTLEVDRGLAPDVNADAGMLRQALMNLAVNACQAMPDGGRLRLACRHGGRDRRVEVTVEDTGVGIPAEHLEKIFDLYFTTRQGGSGIGLSMVYRIVQLHDGEIEVESTPGRGTTFRILLPPRFPWHSTLAIHA